MKAGYRALSMKNHPDRGGSHEKMIRLNQAVEVLRQLVETRDEKRLDQILRYAERGWPVFPCKPHEKIPATPHGFKDATRDPSRFNNGLGMVRNSTSPFQRAQRAAYGRSTSISSMTG